MPEHGCQVAIALCSSEYENVIDVYSEEGVLRLGNVDAVVRFTDFEAERNHVFVEQ